MPGLPTAEVARLAGVNVETLRFYERKGILPEPPRRPSGYREYPPEAVELVRFVKRAQELGFSLKEAQEMLSLSQVPRTKAGKVRLLVQAKLAEIDHKIRDLQAIRQTLDELFHACDGRRLVATCPILEALRGRLCSGDAGASQHDVS